VEATDLSLFEMVGYRSRFSGRAPLVPGAWKNCETQVPFASQCLLGEQSDGDAYLLARLRRSCRSRRRTPREANSYPAAGLKSGRVGSGAERYRAQETRLLARW
jgi:hypothetical protein